MVFTRRHSCRLSLFSCALTDLFVMSKIIAHKTYVKEWMTSTHKKKHWQSNIQSTITQTHCADALCYISPTLHHPHSVTTSILAGELINSSIIQRLPRVELTNHLSKSFPIPLLNDYQWPHCWNTWQNIIQELDLLRVELTNTPSENHAEQQWTQQLLRVNKLSQWNSNKTTLDNSNNSIFSNVVLQVWPTLQKETLSEQWQLHCNQRMTGLPHLSQCCHRCMNIHAQI